MTWRALCSCPWHPVAFSPDGAHLAAGLHKGVINIFALFHHPNMILSPTLLASAAGGLRAAVGALAYSPDGEILVGALTLLTWTIPGLVHTDVGTLIGDVHRLSLRYYMIVSKMI